MQPIAVSYARTEEGAVSKHHAVLEALRRTGHRLTPQRVTILSALAEHEGHLSVDEIYERVKQVYPYVDVATVYRTLQLLKRLHLAAEIELKGTQHYELMRDSHHHLVCQACGQALSLSPSYLERFREAMVEEFGFEPDLDHFAIGGLCARCRQKSTKREA